MDGRCDQPAPCARQAAASGGISDMQLLRSRRRQPGPFHALRSDHAVSRVRHGLHQLLTRIDVAGVSGLQGVEWDAVELPSQFMENYCWEWDVLVHMTAHAQTGAPLPRALFERMLAARNFGSGMAMVRQLELALFDMLLHSAYVPGGDGSHPSPQAVLDAVRREVAVVPHPPY